MITQFDEQQIPDVSGGVVVENILNSNSTTNALSANMGRHLNVERLTYGGKPVIATTGTLTAYVLADSSITSANRAGSRVFARFHVASGAAPTLNVNGTGAAQIRYVSGTALVAGDIPINTTLPLSFDGTYWIIESTQNTQPAVNNAALTLRIEGNAAGSGQTTVGSTFTANDATARTYDITKAQVRLAFGQTAAMGSTTQPIYLAANGVPTAANAYPTVNNPAITLTQGGVSKGSFTLNQAGAATIDFDAGGGGSSTPLVDNLASTSTTSALTANMGRVLRTTVPITTITTATTLALAHVGNVIVCNNTANINITVPAFTNIEAGHKIFINRINTGTVTLVAGTSQVLTKPDDQALTCVRHGMVGLVYRGSNLWSVFGDLNMI